MRKRIRGLRELNYEIDYLLPKTNWKREIKLYDMISFQNILLKFINSAPDIHEKLRRLYICRKFLTDWLDTRWNTERGQYYIILRNSFTIQSKQILNTMKFITRVHKIRYIMKGWVPFNEKEEEWLYRSYANWKWFNTWYHVELRKFKKLKNPPEYRKEFNEFLLRIFKLRCENHNREEILKTIKTRRKT